MKAKFSKWHYVVIADVLATEYRQAVNPSKELGAIYRIAYTLADKFAADNVRFSTEHFLAVVRGERELSSRPTKHRPDNLVDGCWRCEKGISWPHTHDTSLKHASKSREAVRR